MQRKPLNDPNQKLQNIEGLRGLMALWVVAGHAATLAVLPLSPHGGIGRILANGSFAVDVFIIVSGFVIALLLARQHESYGPFLVRRAFRLFPVYWVALLLSVLMLPLAIHFLEALPWHHEHNDVRLEIFAKTQDHFWTHLALHVPLLHGLVPETLLPATGTAFIGQAWSLTLEWQFYLVAPLLPLVVNAATRRTVWILVAVALSFAAATAVPQPSFLFAKLHLFAVGMISHQLTQDLAAKRCTDGAFVRNLTLLGLLFVTQKALLIPWLIWMTTLCSQVLSQPRGYILTAVGKLLGHPVTCWLGRISYPVYCLHMVVLYLCGHALVNLLGVRSHVAYATTLLLAGPALTLALAWLVHRTIEEPMIAIGKRLAGHRRRQPADAVPATAAEESV